MLIPSLVAQAQGGMARAQAGHVRERVWSGPDLATWGLVIWQ